MYKKLGNIIENKPYYIILLIILISLGFSIFIPALEFKTDFSEFAPDNNLVRANNRIADYFGSNQQSMFLLVKNMGVSSVLSPQSLKEQNDLEQKLLDNPNVNGSISIITFLDTICRLEFNTSFENCSEYQIQIAVNDLLNNISMNETQLFARDDPDENILYKKSPLSVIKRSDESTDIKNCYVNITNNSILFSIEVYDLSSLSTMKPPLPGINTMEWYIEFQDILAEEDFKLIYQISARIEPANNWWIVGDALLNNIRELPRMIKTHSLFNTYITKPYLWIKIPHQNISISTPLEEANISFDLVTNRIYITVSRDELGKYGIAPHFGDFNIPAKLSNYSAGVRYYQTPLLKRPGSHIAINTTYLFERINKLHNRLLLGPIFLRLLQRYEGITWDEFSNIKNETENLLSDTFSLTDIDTFWISLDTAPDTGSSSVVTPVFPYLYEELKIYAISLLPSKYEQTRNPQATLILLQIKNANEINQEASINTNIVNQIKKLNPTFQEINVQATGEGVITAQINKSTGLANQKIIPAIFIIVMIILFINFRRLSYVVLPILVFIVTSIWLFGTMSLLHIPFSIISVALIPILIGLGVEYSVNLFVNYRNELEAGKKPIDALKISLKEIGVAIFMAWITTFVAFISFITALIPPVRDFGILLALGITYTFIVTMTLMLTIRYIIDKKRKISINKTKSISVSSAMVKLSGIISHHQKKIFAITIIITLLMGYGLLELKTGFSMNEFIPQDNKALELFNEISDEFPSSSQNQQYILIEGDVTTVATLQGISQTIMNFNNDDFIARNPKGDAKTDSITTIIKEAVSNNNSLISRFNINPSNNIPKTNEDVQNLYNYLYANEEYSEQVRNVLHKEKQTYDATLIRVYLLSSYQSSTSDQTNEYESIKKEMNTDLAGFGNAKAIVTGELFITFSIMTSLTESQLLSTSISFILAILILMFIFRIPSLGAVAMIPVIFSIIWVLGTMYYIGYMLNVLTITVTSITIGAGVNYAIYITQRFRLEAQKTSHPDEAVTATISRTGSAVFIAALSSMLGFGILVTAPIPPQVQFGLITSITLFYAFMTSILVLPLVLARWAKWRLKRKGYIISDKDKKEV